MTSIWAIRCRYAARLRFTSTGRKTSARDVAGWKAAIEQALKEEEIGVLKPEAEGELNTTILFSVNII